MGHFHTTHTLCDDLWPAGLRVLRACFPDCIAENVLLRCVLKKAMNTAGSCSASWWWPVVDRPKRWCIFVLVVNVCWLSLFKYSLHVVPGSHTRHYVIYNRLNASPSNAWSEYHSRLPHHQSSSLIHHSIRLLCIICKPTCFLCYTLTEKPSQNLVGTV